MTRQEHLAWCKERALAYLEPLVSAKGYVQNTEHFSIEQAFTSMMSDMNKHPETKDSSLHQLGMMLLLNGHLDTPEKMREWIRGFN